MQNNDKKRLRKLKRGLKRCGNKRVRQQLKASLDKNPEEAHVDDMYAMGGNAYKGACSENFNGMDHDATRQKESLQSATPLSDPERSEQSESSSQSESPEPSS